MGEAAALLSALTWSATSVAMARLALHTPPLVLSALRLAAGSILLFVVLLLSGQASDVANAPATAIWAMVGSGLLAYAIGDTLYIYALTKVGVQRGFTLSETLFISLTVLGGIVLLDEPFGGLQLVGGVLVGIGVMTIVRGREAMAGGGPAPGTEIAMDERVPAPASNPARSRTRQGYLLILVVGVAWAAATLWLAGGRENLSSLAAASLRTPAGAAGLLAFAAITRPRELVEPFGDWRHIGAISAVGVLGTALGSLMYVFAVGEAGAARTTILSSVSPLMALPLAVIFLREPLRRMTVVGTLVCVVGIVLVVSNG